MGEAREKARFLYLGYRTGVGKDSVKLFQEVVDVTSVENDGGLLDEVWARQQARWYEVKRGKGGGGIIPYGQPGNIYEFEVERAADGDRVSLFNRTGRRVDEWKQADQVTYWQVASKAIWTAREANTAARRLAARKMDYERLAPFKKAYQMARGGERAVVLANVISYITVGNTVSNREED